MGKENKKEEQKEKQEDKVIDTLANKRDGQVKCPNCGASEITPNPKTGKLRCNYCFTEFEGKELNKEKDIKKLKGRTKGIGTSDIKEDAEKVVTLRCGGCGAEVVIDLEHATHARCHWCRSILESTSKVENGAVPDSILPFKTEKKEAQRLIDNFVGKRKFFANQNFRREFTSDNIMGVYFPYLLVDANCHATFKGEGEHLVRRYTVGSGDDEETRYDADAYKIERDFDLAVDGLTIESSSNKIDKSDKTQTNNIINSIMPFDTENCIQYESNYLVGYTSEKRDLNIDNIEEKVETELKDIARHTIQKENKFYDRGVSWKTEDFKVVGTQWMTAYLPVWLYSYLEVKGSKKVLHYVAVNARTNETMGSVPINKPRLLLVSTIIEIVFGFIGLFLFLVTNTDSDDDPSMIFLLLLLSGFIYYGIMYSKYRNQGARHVYEKETKNEVSNLKKVDDLLERRKGLKSSTIKNRNDYKLEGESKKINK